MPNEIEQLDSNPSSVIGANPSNYMTINSNFFASPKSSPGRQTRKINKNLVVIPEQDSSVSVELENEASSYDEIPHEFEEDENNLPFLMAGCTNLFGCAYRLKSKIEINYPL